MEESPTPEGVPSARPIPAPTTTAPITYASAPPKPTPIAPNERIATLDILRGVAVLGILLANIYSFSFEMFEYTTTEWPTLHGVDQVVTLLSRFFVESKFITMFSLLFGMGLALQSERAAANGAPFVAMYSRRLAILFVGGVLHGIFIWHGDILLMYSIIGFVAMACRNVRPSRLLILAAILFIIPCFVQIGFVAIRKSDPNNSILNALDNIAFGFYKQFRHELDIYSSGSYAESISLRAAQYGYLNLLLYPFISMWHCLALFLVGNVIIRKGILRQPNERKAALRMFVACGFAFGLTLQIVDNYLLYLDPESETIRLFQDLAADLGPVGMSLAYIGVIALISLRLRGSKLLYPLACVGRMALSNYIAQSIICTLIFYGYGLGLFGQVSRSQALIVALAVFALQLIVSPIWLRFLRYGPLEWLWRTLTYMKVQPMRLRHSVRERTPSPTLVQGVREDETADG